MALTPANLLINFISNYAGCHRICYRQGGAGPYTCTSCQPCTTNCAGNGAPCSTTIPIMVDNASCVPTVFDGYVQACCEDLTSLNGQIPFSITFTPNPNCKGYTITCVGPVSVNNISLTNPGSGYVAGATIPITISGGGGVGAAATALIGNGGIDIVSASNPGAGYVDGVYANVPAQTLTGVGSGALFTVTVVGGLVTIANVVPGFNGTLYNPGDTFTFLAANLGGAGAGVIIGVSTVNSGQIQSITMTNNGSGYTSQATATFLFSGGGITATGIVLMSPCPAIDIDTCGPTPPLILPGIPLGTGFVACNTTPYQLPPQYTVDQDACCFDCTTITFTKTLGNPFSTVYHEDCSTGQFFSSVLSGGGTVGPVCAVTGSWFVIESNPVTGITNIAVGIACP